MMTHRERRERELVRAALTRGRKPVADPRAAEREAFEVLMARLEAVAARAERLCERLEAKEAE